MKKFYLLLLLLPLFSFANFKGTVVLNDGSTKDGYIKLPGIDDSTLKFRAEQKGALEKLSINDVKEFEIINDNGDKIKFIPLHYATVKSSDQLDLKISKEKIWFKIIRTGKYSLLSTAISDAPMVTSSGMSRFGTGGSQVDYYLWKDADDKAVHIDTEYGGLTFCGDCYKRMSKALAKIFKTDCPELSTIITKEDFKKVGHTLILDIYENNCGK